MAGTGHIKKKKNNSWTQDLSQRAKCLMDNIFDSQADDEQYKAAPSTSDRTAFQFWETIRINFDSESDKARHRP
jgi:hypothetical protein